MSLNSLLESANPYQSLQSDAARLAGKWEKTGLLEGLNGAHKNNMGIILENQAKQLVVSKVQLVEVQPLQELSKAKLLPTLVDSGQELLYH